MKPKQLSPKQLTKLHHARKHAQDLLAGKDMLFQNAVESKQKEKVILIAKAIINYQGEDGVTLLMIADLNSTYKTALAKKPKSPKN